MIKMISYKKPCISYKASLFFFDSLILYSTLQYKIRESTFLIKGYSNKGLDVVLKNILVYCL